MQDKPKKFKSAHYKTYLEWPFALILEENFIKYQMFRIMSAVHTQNFVLIGDLHRPGDHLTTNFMKLRPTGGKVECQFLP